MLDTLDVEIEEHAKRSRLLKEESEKNRRKAVDLAEEEMDDTAKRRLAVYLLCKQLRSNEEAVMADLDAVHLQLVMQPDHPTSQIIEEVNKALRESAAESDKTAQAFNRMSFITQVNVEQSMTELEGYGIKEKSIIEEFQKLKGNSKTQVAVESTPQVTVENTLPQVPEKEETPLQEKRPAEKERGQFSLDINPVGDQWLDKPWMYSEPKSPELLKKWTETWTNYLLRYAENKNIHLINVADLQREYPFNKLERGSFQNLTNILVQIGYGKWWNGKGKLLRIYWRSIDKWVDHVLHLTKEKQIPIISGTQGLIELEPLMATMPKAEIEQVLKMLVKRKVARWVEKGYETKSIDQVVERAMQKIQAKVASPTSATTEYKISETKKTPEMQNELKSIVKTLQDVGKNDPIGSIDNLLKNGNTRAWIKLIEDSHKKNTKISLPVGIHSEKEGYRNFLIALYSSKRNLIVESIFSDKFLIKIGVFFRQLKEGQEIKVSPSDSTRADLDATLDIMSGRIPPGKIREPDKIRSTYKFFDADKKEVQIEKVTWLDKITKRANRICFSHKVSS